ncbi:YheU family protein [Pleionea sediminis]|uniref:YheU family protein n=1 Tax=Pleionea sediminis TaxID=2569479 RepID=UPI001184D302|nr:YheU family protein [Pleionea sediminis]
MIIPWQEIETETLENIVREHILSQLEDYQIEAVQMTQWIEQVKAKLKSGEAVVEWSEANESVAIVDKQKYSQEKS